jgi:hypothetical protein
MANKTANVATAVGIAGGIIMLATPAAPAAVLGIPAILLARAYRGYLDKQQDKQIHRRKESKTMLPSPHLISRRTPYDSDGSVPLWSNPSEWISPHLLPKNPLTALVEESPKLAHDAIITRCLAEAHRDIVAGPANEFAKQGRGMVATTTRKRRGSLRTKIKPL